MTRLVGVFVAMALLGLVASYVHAQAVQYRAADGYMPDTVILKRTVEDSGRVCVEPPDGGILRCRTVGELRRWVMESKAK